MWYRIFGPTPSWPGGWSAYSRYREAQSAVTITNYLTALSRYWRLLARSRLLPLEIPTHSQRACRVQIAIHLTWCVFETRRRESRPTSAWYLRLQTEFSNPYPPNSHFRGGGCSFFPAADGFNPEGATSLYVSLPTNSINTRLFPHECSHVPCSPRVYSKNRWVGVGQRTQLTVMPLGARRSRFI